MTNMLRNHLYDCSPPGSSVHDILQAKSTAVGCLFVFQGIFPIQGSKPSFLHLLHWQVDSFPLSHLGSCNEVPRMVKSTRTESRIVVTEGLGREMGTCYLMDKEFRLMKMFWRLVAQ